MKLKLLFVSTLLFASCSIQQSEMPISSNNNSVVKTSQTNAESSNTAKTNNSPSKIINNSSIETKSAQITEKGIGQIYIGQKIREIKKLYPSVRFEIVKHPLRWGDYTFDVVNGKDKQFQIDVSFELYLDDYQVEDKDRVFRVITQLKDLKTNKDIGVGSSFGDVKKAYSNAKFDSVFEKNQFPQDKVFFLKVPASSKTNFLFYHVPLQKTDAEKYSPDFTVDYVVVEDNSEQEID